jgi:hypothetical protein
MEEATVGCSEEIAVGHVEDSDAEELDGGRRGDLGLQWPTQGEGTEEGWGGVDEKEKGTTTNMAPTGRILGRRWLGTKELGGSTTPAWKKRKVGGHEAGEQVHGAGEGDLAVDTSLMSEDVRTSRSCPEAVSMARLMCANGRGMQQLLELNFLNRHSFHGIECNLGNEFSKNVLSLEDSLTLCV